MNARRACHLRQALDRGLDILARDQHQIGEFVDHHHDIGQLGKIDRLLLEHGLAGLAVEAGLHLAGEGLAVLLRLAQAGVIPIDVAHAELGHSAIAVLHLAHRPFQGHHRLFRFGHHGGEQMRNAVIDRQLQHLRVDHDEAAMLGARRKSRERIMVLTATDLPEPWCRRPADAACARGRR